MGLFSDFKKLFSKEGEELTAEDLTKLQEQRDKAPAQAESSVSVAAAPSVTAQDKLGGYVPGYIHPPREIDPNMTDQDIDGVISVGDAREELRAKEKPIAQKPLTTQKVVAQPGSAQTPEENHPVPEAGAQDSAEVPRMTRAGHYVGADRSLKDIAVQAMSSGYLLFSFGGHAVLDSDTALIAPANPLMSEADRKERIEAMVDHAAKKFPDKPLRLDGNQKFVETAMDAALARGLTVEVPAKYQDLLAQREKAHTQQKQPAPEVHGQEFDGVISASTGSVERNRVTGKLKNLTVDVDKDGMRTVTVQRAGYDVPIKIDGRQITPEQAAPLVGKPVRYEPPAKGSPARVVDVQREKAQEKQKGQSLEVQR